MIFIRIFPNFHIFDTYGGRRVVGVIRSHTRNLFKIFALKEKSIKEYLTLVNVDVYNINVQYSIQLISQHITLSISNKSVVKFYVY